jgi:hypothetical protein
MGYRSMSECNLFPFQEGILDEKIMSSEMNLWRELRSAEVTHRPQRTEDMLNRFYVSCIIKRVTQCSPFVFWESIGSSVSVGWLRRRNKLTSCCQREAV